MVALKLIKPLLKPLDHMLRVRVIIKVMIKPPLGKSTMEQPPGVFP
jgi:hypothetical protein